MMGLTRKHITEITKGLVPAPQRRGLTWKAYRCAHFCGNLLEF
jgi:hypothetical protein